MNRRERRDLQRKIQTRLNQLKKSELVREADLSHLPATDIEKLISGNHENKEMQDKYIKIKNLLDEAIKLNILLKKLKDYGRNKD